MGFKRRLPYKRFTRRFIWIFILFVIFFIITKSFTAYSDVKSGYSSLVEEPKFTVNFNILQYSTFIIANGTTDTRIESLFAFGFVENEGGQNATEFVDTIQCVLKNKMTNEIQFYNATRLLKLFGRPMKPTINKVPWKVICNIDKIIDDVTAWQVAILDRREREIKMENLELTQTQIDSLIQYQSRIKHIDTSKPKLKEVAHCLHAVRDLTQARIHKLLRWLKLQQQLGFKQIRIYFYDNATQYAKQIYEKFDSDYVEVVQHQNNFKDVCEWYIENFQQNPSDKLAQYLYFYCREMFLKLFNFINDDTNFLHGRTQTNDCYLEFKHKYEFTTNYDFDEILLPRKYNPFTTLLSEDNLQNCNLQKLNYSIYNYSVDVFSSFAGGRAKVSSVEFDCLIYLHDDPALLNFTNRVIKQRTSQKRDGIHVRMHRYGLNKTYFYYYMNSTYYNYIDYLVKVNQTYKCLKNKYLSGTDIIDFNNGYLTQYNLNFWYHGKSIFNTDLTEYTTFHYGVPVERDGVYIPPQLPIEMGFVSHFRENLDKYYKIQVVLIRQLVVDIEYYKFFLNNPL